MERSGSWPCLTPEQTTIWTMLQDGEAAVTCQTYLQKHQEELSGLITAISQLSFEELSQLFSSGEACLNLLEALECSTVDLPDPTKVRELHDKCSQLFHRQFTQAITKELLSIAKVIHEGHAEEIKEALLASHLPRLSSLHLHWLVNILRKGEGKVRAEALRGFFDYFKEVGIDVHQLSLFPNRANRSSTLPNLAIDLLQEYLSMDKETARLLLNQIVAPALLSCSSPPPLQKWEQRRLEEWCALAADELLRERFVEKGILPQLPKEDLLTAIDNGDERAIEDWLKQGGLSDEEKQNGAKRALERGQFELVALLEKDGVTLEEGLIAEAVANQCELNKRPETPQEWGHALMVYCQQKSVSLWWVEKMVNQGATLTSVDGDVQRALLRSQINKIEREYLNEEKQKEVKKLKLMIKCCDRKEIFLKEKTKEYNYKLKQEKFEILVLKFALMDHQALECFIEAGAPIGDVNEEGHSLLHLATLGTNLFWLPRERGMALLCKQSECQKDLWHPSIIQGVLNSRKQFHQTWKDDPHLLLTAREILQAMMAAHEGDGAKQALLFHQIISLLEAETGVSREWDQLNPRDLVMMTLDHFAKKGIDITIFPDYEQALTDSAERHLTEISSKLIALAPATKRMELIRALLEKSSEGLYRKKEEGRFFTIEETVPEEEKEVQKRIGEQFCELLVSQASFSRQERRQLLQEFPQLSGSMKEIDGPLLEELDGAQLNQLLTHQPHYFQRLSKQGRASVLKKAQADPPSLPLLTALLNYPPNWKEVRSSMSQESWKELVIQQPWLQSIAASLVHPKTKEFFDNMLLEENSFVEKDLAIQSLYGLSAQFWRLFIDPPFQDKGRHVFDGGFHEGSAEPGFFHSMEKAFIYLLSSLGGEPSGKRDLATYLELHALCDAHQEEELRGLRDRFYRCQVPFDFSACIDFPQVWQEWHEGDSCLILPDGHLCKLGQLAEKVALHGSNFSVSIAPTPEDSETIEERLLALFSSYREEIANAKGDKDKILLAIATKHQELERLHSFRDANSRTNIAWLQKSLIEQGLPPSIVNPNGSYGLSHAAWAEEIKKHFVTG